MDAQALWFACINGDKLTAGLTSLKTGAVQAQAKRDILSNLLKGCKGSYEGQGATSFHGDNVTFIIVSDDAAYLKRKRVKLLIPSTAYGLLFY